MEEVWKDIENHSGIYQISNLGSVKRVGRIIIRADNKLYPVEQCILKHQVDKAGYHRLCLRTDGKQRYFSVHRLVAYAFISNPNNYLEVNHLDGNKSNNQVSNLEWCTRSMNKIHSYRVLGQKKRRSKIPPEIMNEIKLRYSNLKSYKQVGLLYNISNVHVKRIVSNQYQY